MRYLQAKKTFERVGFTIIVQSQSQESTKEKVESTQTNAYQSVFPHFFVFSVNNSKSRLILQFLSYGHIEIELNYRMGKW